MTDQPTDLAAVINENVPEAPEKGLDRLRAIQTTSAGVQLTTLADYWTMATAICRAGMQPRNGRDPMTPAQVMVALTMGAEVGLPPMTALKNIAIVNGRPTIWGDALLALAFRRNLLETIDEQVMGDGDQRTALCTIKRRGFAEPFVRAFSVADAKKAGLWGKPGPWTNYPDRMLAMRARGFCLRDAVPDALGGFTLTEEAQDMKDPESQEFANRSEAMLAALGNGGSE